MNTLEDYLYVLRDIYNTDLSTLQRHTIRFLGRTVGEFKQLIFNKHYIEISSDMHIQCKDIEIVQSSNGEILDNDTDLEYCLSTEKQPFIVYAPTDIDYSEYKDLVKFCNDRVLEYRRYRQETGSKNRLLELQKSIDCIQRAILTLYNQEPSKLNACKHQVYRCTADPSLYTQGNQSAPPPISQSQADTNMFSDERFDDQPIIQKQIDTSQNSFLQLESQISNNSALSTAPQTEVIDLDAPTANSVQNFTQFSSMNPGPALHKPLFNNHLLEAKQSPQLTKLLNLMQVTAANDGINFQGGIANQRCSRGKKAQSNFNMQQAYANNELNRVTVDQILAKWIDLTPLTDRLKILIEIFGGVTYAFDMEWKIRIFVVEVINFALCNRGKQKLDTNEMRQKIKTPFKWKDWNKDNQGLKVDGEKAIIVFGARVQPDLVIKTWDNKKMLYVIEIKNLRTNKGKAIIKQAVCENFKQLRNYCLQDKKSEVSGISTNFGVWIFTKYIKCEEMVGRPSFMTTEQFEVMDMNKDDINMNELRRLVICLQWLGEIEEYNEPKVTTQSNPNPDAINID